MSNGLEGDLNQDGIIDEMDRVRGNLGGGLDQLGEQMRNIFHWQAYVRSAPLTSVAAGLVVGYLFAPRLFSRRAPIVSENAGAGSYQSDTTTANTGGLTSMLSSMIWGGLVKAGSVYLAEVLTRDFPGTTSPDSDAETSAGGTSGSYFDLGDES